MKIYDIYNKIFFMKNLFEINEDEKNRILGLHESATKNHYLISEQSLSNYPVNNIQTVVIGTYNNSNKHTLIDGVTYNNIILGFDRGDNPSNSSGTWYVQNEKYDKEYHSGNWTFDNASKQYTFNSHDGQLRKSGTFVQKDAYNDLIRYVVTKYQNSESMGDTYRFAYYLTNLAKDNNIQIQQNSLLAQYATKNKYEGLQYDGATNNQNQQYVDSGFRMKGVTDDKPGIETAGGVQTKPQPPKYYKEITDLQRKVGEKDDGILGQKTLKAIMDKLSQ